MRLSREAIIARAVLREPLLPLSKTEWGRGSEDGTAPSSWPSSFGGSAVTWDPR